ncbi:MAG: HDOD domain-containing protein, partial [Chloroflexi bacterium]|nr:HDOD domain-containing protein [Chloroflexota bacterium]
MRRFESSRGYQHTPPPEFSKRTLSGGCLLVDSPEERAFRRYRHGFTSRPARRTGASTSPRARPERRDRGRRLRRGERPCDHLRAANSAASAPINRVTTAERAVMRIGLRGTRNIVASAVLHSSFGDLERAGIDLDELWRHLLGCALVADRVLQPRERSAGFTAGLLHDVGRLSLAQSAPDRYASVVAQVRAGADPREAERAAFGEDHEERGAAITAAWALPEELA